MPADFLEGKVNIPFTEYMALIEKTNLKSLLRNAAIQKSENKVKKLFDDYKEKVNKDKNLLNGISELPVISDNPKPVSKDVNPEQEFLEKQPLILRDSHFNTVIKANFDSFLSSMLIITEPHQYQELLEMINKDLGKEGAEAFDVSTKENLILGLANRYAQNAIDARDMRQWKQYNFYMRSLAYFLPILISQVNSKEIEKKAKEFRDDSKVLSKVQKLL